MTFLTYLKGDNRIMEFVNTYILAFISILLTIMIFILNGLSKRVDDLKKDMDAIWAIIRSNEHRITVLETLRGELRK